MAQAPTRRRIGDFDKSFGESLDAIEGKDVFVHDWTVSFRNLSTEGQTEERPFTLMEISETEDGPVKTYHSWSESIAEKLGAIDKAEATKEGPLVARFTNVATRSGRSVWDVK